jgi:hypothetical protein
MGVGVDPAVVVNGVFSDVAIKTISVVYVACVGMGERVQ